VCRIDYVGLNCGPVYNGSSIDQPKLVEGRAFLRRSVVRPLEDQGDAITRQQGLVACEFGEPGRTQSFITAELGDHHRDQDARAGKAMRGNFAIEVRAIPTAFGPAGTEIGFIGRYQPWSARIGFHMWTLRRLGVFAYGFIVQAQVTGNLGEGCPFGVPVADGDPALQPFLTCAFPALFLILPPTIDAFGR
jgi:hypothetical protein